MSNFLSEKLNSLNIYKSAKQSNLANYKPYLIADNFVFISSQLPLKEQIILHEGKIEKDVSIEDTKTSIRLATYNLLWTLSDAIEENNKINKAINENKEISDEKLVFLKVISNLIKSGMGIVGVSTPEKM